MAEFDCEKFRWAKNQWKSCIFLSIGLCSKRYLLLFIEERQEGFFGKSSHSSHVVLVRSTSEVSIPVCLASKADSHIVFAFFAETRARDVELRLLLFQIIEFKFNIFHAKID